MDYSILKKIKIIDNDILSVISDYNINGVVNEINRNLSEGNTITSYKINHKLNCEENRNENIIKSKIIEKIKKENTDYIKCDYGDIITTDGENLCDYIINSIKPKWDGDKNSNKGMCSKKCLDNFKRYYKGIMENIINHGIKTVAIPLENSVYYECEREVIFRVALASILNFLIKLKRKDKERFNEIRKIYIVVYGEENKKVLINILKDYLKNITKNDQLLYTNVSQSYNSYKKEVNNTNYFGIVKGIRKFLVVSDKIFFVNYILRKLFENWSWQRKRIIIEFEVMLKLLIPIIFLIINPYIINEKLKIAMFTILVYFLLETLIYTAKLIFLSDILNSSANSTRSILLLSINYLSINLDFAFFYNLFNNNGRINKNRIINSIFMALDNSGEYTGIITYIECIEKIVIFYFIGIVFAYFIGSFKGKKFNVE